MAFRATLNDEMNQWTSMYSAFAGLICHVACDLPQHLSSPPGWICSMILVTHKRQAAAQEDSCVVSPG